MIYQDNQVCVSYDATVPCVIWTPIGYLKGDQFRIPFVKGMDFMEDKITSQPNLTWLNDARKLRTVAIEDIKWLNKNVNDRASKFGAKKVAFVLPESVFGRWAIRMYVELTQSRANNNLDIKTFKTIDDAKDWLRQEASVTVKEVTLK